MADSPLEAVRRLNVWQEVPARVVDLYRRVVVPAYKVAQLLDKVAGPDARVYLDTFDGDLGLIHVCDPAVHVDDKEAALAKMAEYADAVVGPQGPEYTLGFSRVLPRPDSGFVLVKNAAFLQGPADAFSAAQKPLGGPHPLSASIVGGLLGAGVGYGGGYLAEQLAGDSVEKGRLRRTGAILGGLGGAVPGAWWGATNMRHPKETGGGLEAWTSGWPFQPPKAASVYDDLELPDPLAKSANPQASGAMYLPSIPVDAFNRVVWQDVHRNPNPYGTKDPYGDNEQPLYTPPPVAAAISGIVAGAGAATGMQHVSPWSVALTAATTAGKGYLSGLVLGKTLGALAGLRPEVQDRLQQVGLWGGLVTGAVNELFGE